MGALLLVAVAGAHVLLAMAMRVPITHPDELGYLDNARYLVHGDTKLEVQYYPGFSLLLIPLWLATEVPLTVWRGALVINSALAALGVLVTWLLCGRLAPGLRGWRRLAATGVVAAYPALVLYSNLSLSESLFVVLFGVVVLVAARAVASDNASWWGLLGLVSTALALVHPRGFAVVVAVALLGGVVLWPWWRRPRSMLDLAAGVCLGVGVTWLLVHITHGASLNGFAAYEPDGIISKSLSAHGLASLVWELAGQLFYLSVATVGLVPLGLFLGLRAGGRVVRGDRTTATLTRAFVALSFLGVWALSSLFMNLGDRADKLVYGRYNEGVIVPLLVMALAELLIPARRRRFAGAGAAARLWVVTAVVTTGLTGAAVYLGRTHAELRGALNPVNVLGVYPLLHWASDHIDVLALAGVGIGLVLVLALIAWRWPAVALAGVAGLFVFTSSYDQARYFAPGSASRASQVVVAEALARAGSQFGVDDECIGYDDSTAVNFNYFADRFLLPGRRFVWFDADAGDQPCGPLVVSGHADLATTFPGARLVVSEDYVLQSLWVLPGPLQDEMAGAGWLLPTPTPGPLPTPALHAVLQAPGRQDRITVVAPGSTRAVRVLAVHDGGGSPWPSVAGLKQQAFATRLSVQWYRDGQPDRPVTASSVALPRDILPGETAHLSVPLTAAGSAGALSTGSYHVHLSLYQQDGPAFAGELILPVTVTPG